jgi:hypothetical protein
MGGMGTKPRVDQVDGDAEGGEVLYATAYCAGRRARWGFEVGASSLRTTGSVG